ncbi:hypothetical protein NLO88_27605 [Pseudomonas syringae]|nr:hypothetical protein [Pseudomonas syringae]MDG6403451.1 hypothetical protein [Pseudomonas quasicaspiana]
MYGSLPESVVGTFNVIYAERDFDTGALGVIPANTPQEFPSMFVTSTDKDASLIADSVVAPIVTDKAVSFADDSSVRFELKSPVKKITFGVFAKASNFLSGLSLSRASSLLQGPCFLYDSVVSGRRARSSGARHHFCNSAA